MNKTDAVVGELTNCNFIYLIQLVRSLTAPPAVNRKKLGRPRKSNIIAPIGSDLGGRILRKNKPPKQLESQLSYLASLPSITPESPPKASTKVCCECLIKSDIVFTFHQEGDFALRKKRPSKTSRLAWLRSLPTSANLTKFDQGNILENLVRELGNLKSVEITDAIRANITEDEVKWSYFHTPILFY